MPTAFAALPPYLYSHPSTWTAFIDDTSVSDICYGARSYQQQW
jgi:hypothetical protein